MQVIVDKVFQSPSTPVDELSYLITFTDIAEDDLINDIEVRLISYLETRSNPMLNGCS